MRRVIEPIKNLYSHEGHYVVKKVQYTVLFLFIMFFYSLIHMFLVLIDHRNISQSMIIYLLQSFMFILCSYLITRGRLVASQNFLILSVIGVNLTALVDYNEFRFYSQIIIILIVAVTIHINKKQIVITYILVGGMVLYRSYDTYRAIVQGKLPYKMLNQSIQAALGIFFFSIIMYYFDRVLDDEIQETKELGNVYTTDTLTHLDNRASYNRVIKRIKEKGNSYVIAILDIDLFKKVNDKFGHQKGDQVLIAIANLMRDQFKEPYFICRWGGEEFAVVGIEVSDEEVYRIIDEFREIVKSYNFDIGYPLTISGGIAKGKPTDDPVQVEIKADNAMYEAKHDGRNQIKFSEVR